MKNNNFRVLESSAARVKFQGNVPTASTPRRQRRWTSEGRADWEPVGKNCAWLFLLRGALETELKN